MKTLLSAIFVFMLVILVHEGGHFLVAKLVGIKVNEFSIGMGPKIFQKRKGETKYSLRVLPIGGYVAMEGEDELSDDRRSFNNAPAIDRILVILAGAFMNFLLAIMIFSIISIILGTPTNEIDNVLSDTPAFDAGIKPGDKIISINNVEIKTWEDIVENVGESKEEIFNIEIERNKKVSTFKLSYLKDGDRKIIGIIPKRESSLRSSIKSGVLTTKLIVDNMFDYISKIFKGNFDSKSLSGPVGIINEINKAAKSGIIDVLFLLGLISVNLGFFNLLPIPGLDGSKVVFILIEMIRGKAIDKEKEAYIHLLGFTFLITLMLIVTYNDIFRR